MRELIAQAEAIRAIAESGDTLRSDPRALRAALGLIKALTRAGEGSTALALVESLGNRMEDEGSQWEFAILRLEAYASLKRYAHALNFWNEWLEAHSGEPPPGMRIRFLSALSWVGYCKWGVGDLGSAESELNRVYGELTHLPDSEALGWCAINLGNIDWTRGDLNSSRLRYEEALVSARRSGSYALEAAALQNLALIARMRARWKEAEDLLSEALLRWRAIQNRHEEFQAHRSLALIAFKRGNLNRASEYLKESLATAAALGSEAASQHALLLLGLISLAAGDFEAARTHFLQVFENSSHSPTSRPALLAHEYLGDVALEQGNAAEALEHYERVWPRALAIAPKGDIVAELRRRRAEAFLILERRSDAYDEAKAALEHCRSLGDRYEEAATYRVLALAASGLGKINEARSCFEQGFAFFDDIETPYEWGKLWLSHGQWLEADDPARAAEAYRRAETLFRSMGAGALLKRTRERLEVIEKALASAGDTGDAVSAAAAARQRVLGVHESPRARTAPRSGRGGTRGADLDRRSDWAREHFGMVTRYPMLLDLLEQVARLARSELPVFVLGESGVGKELVAHAVHQLSGRPGTFVPINCGGIPRELVESELFGHMRGAFTGAVTDKPGLLELGAEGTVFLDEVAEMPVEAQTRLLRFLESGELRRVGQTTAKFINVRVVAATNRPREELEAGQRFRRDLYYRLGNVSVTLPPLRQRGDDASLLLDHFWRRACSGQADPPILSDDARDKLVGYSWPGNVRQLKHVIQRIVAMTHPGSRIEGDDIVLEGPKVASSLAETLEEEEKQHIQEALKAAHGSKTEAARILGMRRTTLLGKIRRYGLA